MGTQYYVYVNNSLRKAQVHTSKCKACKFALDRQGGSSGAQDWWEGPFDKKEAAWEYAQSGAAQVGGVASKCMMCKP